MRLTNAFLPQVGSNVAPKIQSVSLTTAIQNKLAALIHKLRYSYPAGKFSHKAVDITDYEAVDGAMASAVDEYGQIDILINNASLPQLSRT